MHLEMNAWSCEMKCLCFVELQDNTAEQNCVLAVLSTNQLEGTKLIFLRHNLIKICKLKAVQRFRSSSNSFERIIEIKCCEQSPMKTDRSRCFDWKHMVFC